MVAPLINDTSGALIPPLCSTSSPYCKRARARLTKIADTYYVTGVTACELWIRRLQQAQCASFRGARLGGPGPLWSAVQSMWQPYEAIGTRVMQATHHFCNSRKFLEQIRATLDIGSKRECSLQVECSPTVREKRSLKRSDNIAMPLI